MLGLCNAQVYSHMMAPLSWRSAGQQQQERHRIDEPLSVLNHPAVTLAQANSAQLELALLFSNNTNSTNTPTPVRVQGLVSLLSHTTPAAAAAAASTLIILTRSQSSIAIHFLQQAAALSAVAQLLKGTGAAAQAAVHLLLTLAGQNIDIHFETPINNGVHLQHIMSHPGILNGLVHQMAQVGDSAAAAAVVLARWTVTSSSGEARSAKSCVAAALTKTCTALSCAAELLLHRGSQVCLADAAAQLLHTVAQAGHQAAQNLLSARLTVPRLVGLAVMRCKQPPTASLQQTALSTAAAWRAAQALAALFENADTSMRRQMVSQSSIVVPLVQALQQTEDAPLQERALHVLSAAISKKEETICSMVIAQPALAEGLLPLLPGAATPMQAAHDFATSLAASSSRVDCARFLKNLVAALLEVQKQAGAAVPLKQIAVEQAAWVLTQLAPARKDNHQQLKDVVPMLKTAASGRPDAGKFRDNLANRLAALALQPVMLRDVCDGTHATAPQQAAG